MNETFSTVAKFQYSSEAQIIKGRLESEGIEVFLQDNLTIDTDPLVSNAIGGVKLKVLTKDKETALHIIDEISRYSLDDKGDAVLCPKCSKNKIVLYSTIKDFKSLMAFLVGFLFGTLPFHTRYKYRCEDCKTEFSIK